MTRIRASCPDCGEVDLRPDDVVLRVVRADDGLVGDGSSYRFCCPACTGVVSKPADERIAQLLTTGGVAVEDAHAVAARGAQPGPAGSQHLQPPHPEAPPAGPALNHDDLLDLHLALQRPDWYARLAGLDAPS